MPKRNEMEEQKYNELIRQAMSAMKSGNIDKAINDFTEAINLNPKGASAYSFRGMAYGHSGKFDQGSKDYSKAIELNPNESSNYLQRGLCYIQLDQYEQSIKDFTEAIRLRPDYHLAYMGRGTAYRELNQNDNARRDLEKVISLNPNDATLSDAKNMLSTLNEVKSIRVGLNDLCFSCRKLPTEDGMSVEDFFTTLSNNPIKWLECGGDIGIIRILNNAIVMSDEGCTTCGGKIINWAKALGLTR